MLIIRTSHLNHNMITFCRPHIMTIQVITLSHTCFKFFLDWFQTKNILTRPLFYEFSDAWFCKFSFCSIIAYCRGPWIKSFDGNPELFSNFQFSASLDTQKYQQSRHFFKKRTSRPNSRAILVIHFVSKIGQLTIAIYLASIILLLFK